MGCLVCVCFLEIIVCKDDEIPAFSTMMKMGLNCLIGCVSGIFLFSLIALRENMSHVTFRDVSRCLIGSRASYGHHGSLLGFAS